ncbi:MAG: class I SAM-dependent methyltransferase [Rhodocyclaceae bacterium]|nr:class I SAM-dependent methyltransferase [Rhodocyclaceae bacterium]
MPLSAAALDWWRTPLGAHLLAQEQDLLDPVVQDVFGYHAVQLGMPAVDLLRESRIQRRGIIAVEAGDVRARPDQLPLADRSVDLLLLPHVLEFAGNPHAVLREADRVLMPEGRLIILGFNPFSLWGVRHFAGGGYPWAGRFIPVPRLHDWLQLLDLETRGGRYTAYAPPLRSPAARARWAFMEKAGDRWWPMAGGVYMLQAVKRVRGLRVLQAQPARRTVARPVLVAAGRNHRHLRLVERR